MPSNMERGAFPPSLLGLMWVFAVQMEELWGCEELAPQEKAKGLLLEEAIGK